jgi:hypothetical protein
MPNDFVGGHTLAAVRCPTGLLFDPLSLPFRDVVRCVPNDFVGGHTLAAVRCPTGLLFDLDGQVCDWAHRVSNCDKLTKPRNARPNFKTQVFKLNNYN